jgi:hypothetical protein
MAVRSIALDVLADATGGQAIHLLAHDADPARQFDVLTQFTQALATDLAGGGQRSRVPAQPTSAVATSLPN